MAWSDQLAANAWRLAASSAGIGLASWAIRSRYQLDKLLDRDALVVRWLVVSLCWIVAALPTNGFSVIRATAMCFGAAFLWWPNSVFHTMKYLRRSDFTHLGAELRRLNPIGLPSETPEDRDALALYDSFVPRVLDVLERGQGPVGVERVLAEIRSELGAKVEADDRPAALAILSWWRGRHRSAA
jgi:hypothetical protein